MKQPTSIQATSILPHDRQRNDKLRTFAKFAFSMNGSAQRLNHIVYVCQAQAKALHIVAVAGMHAIELVENLFRSSRLMPIPLSSIAITIRPDSL